VWANLANVSTPVIIQTPGSPFFDMPATLHGDAMRGSDFDYLLFYPRPEE
jgi:hypothetical protein